MKTMRIALRIEPEIIEQIKLLAQQESQSMSAIVRTALIKYIKTTKRK